jgi:hypothetical protein
MPTSFDAVLRSAIEDRGLSLAGCTIGCTNAAWR